MPIYHYICSNCSESIDKLQKISDEPYTICPQCQQPTLNKQLTAPVFRLKGAGWYETDFKTGNKKNLASDESPKTAATKDSKNTKADKPKETTKAPTESKTTSSDKTTSSSSTNKK